MHKYKLASNKLPKTDCPKCYAKKHWQRYLDTATGKALPSEFGKCDNIGKCGWYKVPPLGTKCFHVPFDSIIDHNAKTSKIYCSNGLNYYLLKSQILEVLNNGCYVSEWFLLNTKKPPIYLTNDVKYYSKDNVVILSNNLQPRKEYKPTTDIPDEVLLHTLKNYDTNTFVNFLFSKFNRQDVTNTLQLYSVGTCNKYITFPFISIVGHCRAISLIEYSNIGKRVKTEPQARNIHTYLSFAYTAKGEALPTWLNNYKNSENKFNCLFGENLINQFKHKPIAIVEAPKTAIIASMFYPEYLWLACGGLGYLTANRIEVLKNRDVYLFADNSINDIAFNQWNNKAIEFGFTCVNILEQIATDENKSKGYDLADYILENCQIKVTTPIIKPLIQLKPPILETNIELKIAIPENNFHNQILELTEYFETAKLENKGEINLCSGTKIIDLMKFVDSHLETINTYYNKPIAIPYLQRLSKLKSMLSNSL